MVNVDRSLCPPYPDWKTGVLHPELERKGPSKYSLRQMVEVWRHPQQEERSIFGADLYGYLESTGELNWCLNLQDAQSIQPIGAPAFLGLFGDNVILLPGTVITNGNDQFILVMYVDSDKVVVEWRLLFLHVDKFHPILRFRSG